MLKDKERRDTFLLVSMGLVMVLFVLYLTIPLGKTKKPPAEPEADSPPSLTEKTTDIPVRMDGEGFFFSLNQKLESELSRISESILNSGGLFRDYPVENLEDILLIEKIAEKTRKAHSFFFAQLKKARMIGFYDLKDLFRFEFPDDVSGQLKFNIYTALFLLKLKSENVLKEIFEFPDALFRQVVTCIPYLKINNEVEKDHQALPVLFYFQALTSRLDMFPTTDVAGFFRARINDIRDLSPGKWIAGIMELLNFSSDPQPYRISWKEADDLNPDDFGVYPNLKLKTFVFLKQVYLVFPDFQNPDNNAWIKSLCDSDSGDIELADLKISHEDAGKNIRVEMICYTPGKSQFIVLLKPYNFSDNAGMLNKLVSSRLENFLQNFLQVDFHLQYENPESFKKELLQFGHFLKAQVNPSLK